MYNKKIYLQLSGKEFAALLPPLVVSSIKRIILFGDNKTSIKQILKAFFRTFKAIIEVFRCYLCGAVEKRYTTYRCRMLIQ